MVLSIIYMKNVDIKMKLSYILPVRTQCLITRNDAVDRALVCALTLS